MKVKGNGTARLVPCMAVMLLWGNPAAAEPADYVLKNGAIYTIDARMPKVEAVAITGKKISYVGSNPGIKAFVGKNTNVIDLKGRMLMPGFVEAHIHPTMAFLAEGADLQCDTVEQMLESLKTWAAAHPDEKVIRGFGWRYFLFPTTGPNKADLDKLFPNRPVLLVAIDVHSAWVNSKALELAGVNAKSPDPAPGFSYYQRDPKTSEPTGWVVEGPAEQEILHKLEPPTPEAVIAATAAQLPKLAAAGITAAFDAGIPLMPMERGFEAYQQLEKDNKLPLRIVGCYYWNNPAITDPVAIVQQLLKKYNSELVQARVLKIMLDGGESQHTAVMLKPYADRPGEHGDFLLNPKLFSAVILKAQANGIDTHAHSYGDGATRAYLDAVENAHKAYPASTSRHTASHALFLLDEEVGRLAKLNVTMQTSAQWFTPDPTLERILAIVGKDVVSTEYARMNSVLKAGGRLALGTDWPASGWVATYRPLDAIQVALTRSLLTQYGKQQVLPVVPPENERISLDQALKAYTLDAAYVLGQESRIGSLKVGKLADIIVIDKDLHKVAPTEISSAKVQFTMMNGRITFRNGI